MAFKGKGGMGNMLKQAQKLQAELAKAQEEIKQKTVEASSGGGAVKVVVSGKNEIIDLKINPEAVDPEDVEMLEDMVKAAVNEGLRKVEELMSSEMGKLTQGFKIPGLF